MQGLFQSKVSSISREKRGGEMVNNFSCSVRFTGFELTVCNVQFAHRFGPNTENCISLFKMMCKFLLPSVKAYNPTVAIDLTVVWSKEVPNWI